MRAAVMTGYNEPMVIEQLTMPELGSYDAIVEIQATGVCHSDLTVLSGGFPYPAPLILGHEGAGVVTKVGDQVTRVKVGDRVVASFTPTCGKCFNCEHYQTHLCTEMSEVISTKAIRTDGTTIKGMSGLGTWANEMRAHEDYLVPIRSDLPMDQLALIGCGATTGLGSALNTAQIKPGSTVAIIGCGGVGMFALMGAVLAGAGRVIAIDPLESKRAAALAAGATDIVDPTAGSVPDQVRSLTRGVGADYALEVVGLPDTMRTALEVTRRGGTTVFVGMPRLDAQITLPAFTLFYEGKTMLGCNYGSAQVRTDFQRWIDLIEAGRLDLSSVISKHYALDDINTAIDDLKAGTVLRGLVTL
jgi:S-(hydroxymethyl)glutathione dehydrogenase/alcohol dehydrogenase